MASVSVAVAVAAAYVPLTLVTPKFSMAGILCPRRSSSRSCNGDSLDSLRLINSGLSFIVTLGAVQAWYTKMRTEEEATLGMGGGVSTRELT